ncbi:hypothetical protein FHW89_000961 [Mucilaginibacter sp. SG564]|nr:hypothetical protein [Mucilaginibacter sp. SG564]
MALSDIASLTIGYEEIRLLLLIIICEKTSSVTGNYTVYK